MAVSRNYSSVAQPTTLSGSIDAGAVTIGVVTPIGYPAPPFTAALDDGTAAEELVQVTNASAGTWTVIRAVDGTSAQSHSIGATVRHVASARDFADSRAHEAATADVHGVTGALVGASTTQTLANKTLTSPTINSAALSGAMSGSPAFTGTPTFNGAALSGTYSGSPTFSGTPVFSAGASLSGTLSGSPTASGAVAFTGAPVFSGAPVFQRTNATDVALRAKLAADTQDRLQVRADGHLLFGSGSAAQDAVLYRNGVGQLKTDTDLVVVGGLTAGNMNLGAWTTWTPVWSTSTGAHAPSFGNATVTGMYVKLGRTVIYSLAVAFGSSTNFGGGTTADNWLFTLPGGLTASTNFSGSSAVSGMGRAALSAGSTVPFTFEVQGSDPTKFFMNLSGGRVDAVQIINTGAMDSATPWTWTTTSSFQCFGVVETTT